MPDSLVVSQDSISLVGAVITWLIATVAAFVAMIRFIVTPRVEMMLNKRVRGIETRVEQLEVAVEKLRVESQTNERMTESAINRMTTAMEAVSANIEGMKRTLSDTRELVVTVKTRLDERDRLDASRSR